MHYYDHYHDPSAHLQLTRQREDELLRAAEKRDMRPTLIGRVCAALRGSMPAPPPEEEATIAVGRRGRDAEVALELIRELRAVRRRLEVLETRVSRLYQ